MSDEAKFRIRDRVRVGGVTALRGQTGVVRGVRRAGGESRCYFVHFDDRLWPAIPENGMWVHEGALSLMQAYYPGTSALGRRIRPEGLARWLERRVSRLYLRLSPLNDRAARALARRALGAINRYEYREYRP